jgi:hypothetical protein
MTIHYEFVDSIFFSFNFPCNLTSCLIGDFDKILIKDFFKIKNKFYTSSAQQNSGGAYICETAVILAALSSSLSISV